MLYHFWNFKAGSGHPIIIPPPKSERLNNQQKAPPDHIMPQILQQPVGKHFQHKAHSTELLPVVLDEKGNRV